MTIAGKILAFIFGSFTRSAVDLFNKQPTDIKDALIRGSAIVDIINQNINLTPTQILSKIIDRFGPDLTNEDLCNALSYACNQLNISTDEINENAISLIRLIQSILFVKGGSTWAAVSSFVAKLISFALSKDVNKKWSIFELLMQTVYDKFVKK